MHPPPSPAECPRYPITAGIAVLAIVGTLRYWSGVDIDRFTIGCDRWWLEPWRLLTPVLFHLGPLHLIFNLYWLWVFGTKVEDEFGHGRTLGIYVLLAAGSNTADEAFSHGGVGLSGVVYGLFGMLWVLSSRDRRFRDAVDRQTVQLMVGWFFLCIVLTIVDVWRIANVAHGAGCALGALLGWAISARNAATRWQRSAILGAVVLLCILGGTVARPYVTFSKAAGHDYAYRGYVALEATDYQRAASLYESAVIIDARQPGWWHNLGYAYRKLGRFADADKAFRRETDLRPEGTDPD
jgi:membrane associated rhomboid family serine protease